MRLQAINHWHIVISGFLQNRGQPHGMVRLWSELRAKHVSPETVVNLCSWNTDWRDRAEQIFRMRNGRMSIRVYAYSWGAGWGAIQLAKELGKRGHVIKHMVLSDPVYRSPLFLLRPLSMTSLVKIRIPTNVQRVSWFRQNKNRPHAHNLIAVDRQATTIEPAEQAKVTHQYMDDWRAFHKKCHEVAEFSYY